MTIEKSAVSEIDEELARLLRLPHGARTSTRLLQRRLQLVDGASFAAQYREIFVNECYDFQCEDSTPIIIDGGANVGAAVIWWLSRWPNARVLAYEPDPAVFEALWRNTRLLKGVELHRCALAAGGNGLFWAEGTDAGRLLSGSERADEAIEVPTVSLSAVLKGLPRVDLLKLDIEGAETEVLEEAEAQLPRVQRIFVEYHSLLGRRQLLSRLIGVLERQGFRYYIEGPSGRVRPFCGVPVDRGVDLQCNIFAWRVASGQPKLVPKDAS